MAEERAQRRLAAILAADVVGYSRLIEQDEAATLTALKQRRREILQPLVAAYQGRIVKVMGDGVLIEFASAVNAVACAVELQKKMTAADDGAADGRHIVLRTGVSLGDVVVEGGDLYGAGIIIAVRLQTMAEPGGICLTGGVHEQIGNKLPLTFDDLGLCEVKNIAKPIQVFRVRTSAPELDRAMQLRPREEKPCIAVLPFTNMSGDPEQQYFSDGVTADIITELSRFRDLLVIARDSSFKFRDRAVGVKRVGQELGAQFVLEGGIRKLGNQVRITAQLVDAATGNHLWAERYDRDLADVFALQEELAHAIAATVGGRVQASRGEWTMRLNPAGLTAYDLTLRAKALLLKFTKNDALQALTLAQRAVEIDPNNARAHARYAHIAFNIWMAYWTGEREGMFEDARRHAERAVALDESDTDTRSILGFVKVFMRHYDEARLHLEKALSANPNEVEARLHYAVYLTATGQPDAAIEQIEIAKRLNPFDFSWTPWITGIALFTAHRYDDAIAVLSQAPEPINEIRGWLAASYAQAGRLEEAKACLDQFLRGAKQDMVVYPGDRLKDWEPYWHGALEYRDQADFDHLFAALRKAGLPE